MFYIRSAANGSDDFGLHVNLCVGFYFKQFAERGSLLVDRSLCGSNSDYPQSGRSIAWINVSAVEPRIQERSEIRWFGFRSRYGGRRITPTSSLGTTAVASKSKVDTSASGNLRMVTSKSKRSSTTGHSDKEPGVNKRDRRQDGLFCREAITKCKCRGSVK